MDSWDSQTVSPSLKFEHSPAESFLSVPGDMYPPLFGNATPASTTMNPLEIMTPHSFSEDHTASALSTILEMSPDSPSSPSSDRKQGKKRKSWGQVLPEPKTNLPPRKRAKTDDEKEQRRVERVLRNRRAAQSSRERKRLEVEALEKRNNELEAMLRQVQQTNLALVSELQKVQTGSGVVSRTSPAFNPVTFSHELFSSHDGHISTTEQQGRCLEELLLSAQPDHTVNPASLSPALTPVADDDDDDEDDDEDDQDDDDDAEPASTLAAVPAAATTVSSSPDPTQHPAAMLCQDLQCRSAEAAPRWLPAAALPQQPHAHPALALWLPFQLLLASTSVMLSIFQRPLMQIAISLKAGSSLPQTPSILNTIIWLVTTPLPRTHSRPPTSTSSTSMTTSTISPPLPPSSSTTAQQQQQRTRPLPHLSSSTTTTTLRLKSLRKILSSSPILARPLMDATMAALRLVSSEGQQVSRVSVTVNEEVHVGGSHEDAGAKAASEQPRRDGNGRAVWQDGTPLPSYHVLLTLLWTITIEERRIAKRRGGMTGSNRPKRLGRQLVPRRTNTPTSSYVLKIVPADSGSAGGMA